MQRHMMVCIIAPKASSWECIICTCTILQADEQTVEIAFHEYGAASTLGFAASCASAASEVLPLGNARVPAHVLHSIQSGLATGFQLASAAGPLCDEPLWGIAFEVG